MVKLNRVIKNIKNYFSSIEKSKQSVGQINRDTEEGQILERLIKQNKIAKVLEIGTWNGLGSTKTILEVLDENIDQYYFTSIESDIIFYKRALKNLKDKLNKNVQILLGRIIEIEELPDIEEIDFEKFGFDPKNIEWYIQDLRRYKKIKNIYHLLPKEFDLIFLDGGEFSTYPEFLKLYKKTKFLCLDDTDTYKQFDVINYINDNKETFEIYEEMPGFAVYKVNN
tara:strand:- start:201 stop:875 length:675 start_codon:yes stop_codon:yes gene_type:complete